MVRAPVLPRNAPRRLLQAARTEAASRGENYARLFFVP